MKNFALRSAFVLAMSISMLACSSDSDSGPAPQECPLGFTGEQCNIPITPKKIRIHKIRVTGFPNLKPSGLPWDIAAPGFTNPDIFPVLSSNEGNTLLFVGTPVSDAVSSGNDIFDFIPSQPIEITRPSDQYNLYLYDQDTGSPEFMGGWDFFIYSPATRFPQILSVGTGAGNVRFDLYLAYEW